MTKTFYITTPIYYINSAPHMGHAYTQIAADARARFERSLGNNVYFLTGTDEHGVKVARAAQALGRDIQEHADQVSAEFRHLSNTLGITFDDFIRTTEQRHKKVAQAVIEKLWTGGHLELGLYSGWYSVPDETFFRTEDTIEREGSRYIATPSEDQSRLPLEWVEETTHFFKLSQFQEQLLDYYEAHPETLGPEARRNETLAYLRGGLRDVSVTRELEWGIPVPATVPHYEKHSIYVWFEALINYLSAPGYLMESSDSTALFDQVWPCDLQLMSKDIFTRFHATLWPAMLLALGLELPKRLYAHGFWTVDGRKMSKRDPETIVDPVDFASQIANAAGCKLGTAVDAIRYYCLREVTFGSDGDFSREGCIVRYNSDLANGLGNLVNRALSMLQQYCGSEVPPANIELGLKKDLGASALVIGRAYESLNYSSALLEIWNIISRANQLIEEQKPWVRFKQGDGESVSALLVELLAVCQWCSVVLAPVMPHVTTDLRQLLGIDKELKWSDATATLMKAGHQCLQPQPLFPRIQRMPQTADKTMNNESSIDTQITNEPIIAAPEAAPEPQRKELIEYADFAKIDLRVGTVIEAERVPKADKLLRLQVDLGTEKRQILAGIAQTFEPEKLIGTQVVIVANLAPRKLRGFESQGMLLAASEVPDAPAAGLVTVSVPVIAGSYIR